MEESPRLLFILPEKNVEQWQFDSITLLAKEHDTVQLEIVLVQLPLHQDLLLRKSVLQRVHERLLELKLRKHRQLAPATDLCRKMFRTTLISNENELLLQLHSFSPHCIFDFTANRMSLQSDFKPEFGTCYFSFLNSSNGRTYIDAFDNIVRGVPWVDVSLLCQNHEAREATVQAARFPLVWCTLERLYETILSRCAKWPSRVLTQVLDNRFSSANSDPHDCTNVRTNAQVVHLVTRWSFERIRCLLKNRLAIPQMNVGIVETKLEQVFTAPGSLPVRWLPRPSQDFFLADCAVDGSAESLVLLAERFDYLTRRGNISAIDVAKSFEEGRIVDSPSITEPVHFSYPMVFEFEENTYCLVDCVAEDRVPIYIRKGEDWHPHTNILQGYGVVDPTILEHDGLFWMFCSPSCSSQDELIAFYAETPFSTWYPHKQNPLKQDVTCCRPAGNFFHYKGDLYRPAQDVSLHYGYGVALCKVNALSIDEYSEEVACRLYADHEPYYSGGYHTLSVVNDHIAIDGVRYSFSLSDLAHKVHRLWKRRCQKSR